MFRRLRRAVFTLLWITCTCPRVPGAATLYAVAANATPAGNSGLYTIDPAAGTATWVGTLRVGSDGTNTIYNGGLAYDPYTDRLYALGCDTANVSQLYLVDRGDASMTVIGPLGGEPGLHLCYGGLTFDGTTGRLFAIGDTNDPFLAASVLREVNPATGQATTIGLVGARGTYLGGLGCDPRTGVLYANGFADFTQQSQLFQVNKATGAVAAVGSHGLTLGRQMNYSGLAFDPASGNMLGIGSLTSGASALFAVNRATGFATKIGAAPGLGLTVDGAPVYVGTDLLLGVEREARGAAGLRAWPAPTNAGCTFAFALVRAGAATLTITDVAGRMLVRRAEGRLDPGAHQLRWDGRDEAGAALPPGTYFAALRTTAGEALRTTLHVVR